MMHLRALLRVQASTLYVTIGQIETIRAHRAVPSARGVARILHWGAQKLSA